MKHKVNILIPIFIFLVLVYTVRGLLGPSIQTESLRRGSMEDMVSTKGLMIKYETVMDPGAVGSLEPLVQEGARVATGQQIAAIYSGRVDTDVKNRLEQLNKKIVQIEKNQANLLSFSSDVSRLEQKITEQTALLVENSLRGDLLVAGEIQLVLQSLCERKAQLSGSGTSRSLLEELRAQKEALEAQAGTASQYLAAASAGVFSTTIDGMEETITPYNMTDLTPQSLDALLEQAPKTPAEGAGVCKVVQNFRYFIAVNLPTDKTESLHVGNSVNLRFYDLTEALVPVTVLHISPEEDGRQTVIVEGNQHVESLLKRRSLNLEFIRKRNSGYVVSVKSLRTKNDVTGVYVRREDMLKFIPVTILYNTKDAAIVDSADKNTPLRLYDEVVVRAASYEEGKLLR
ncbi:MAG: hypothetical protein E7402_05350 [Ruminococcaceae bacterium]|nr:hypothetical protein [Oscillospiraceae bacterium]